MIPGASDVRPRIYGEDTPTMAWIRSQGRFDFLPTQPRLPSSEFATTDIDAIVHHHRVEQDYLGIREVQMLLHLEIKSFGGVPSPSQSNTLFMQHQALYDCARNKVKTQFVVDSFCGKKVSLWHFGVSFISHGTKSIENCENANYGRFDALGKINWRTISREEFLQILEFRRRADNLKPMKIGRHHVEKKTVVREREPLGFVSERVIRTCK